METGEIKPDQREEPLMAATSRFLIQQKILVPGHGLFRSMVRSSRAKVAGRKREKHLDELDHALGMSLRNLPIVRRYDAAQELLRYPPAWRGKANLKTMSREAQIQAELDEVIRANKLPRKAMLQSPNLVACQRLVERPRPSHLSRVERRALVEALPFYLVARWRDAQDTVLSCFVRKARLLRFNLKALNEMALRDASMAFLERAGPRFHNLHRAFIKTLETGSVVPLGQFRRFLGELDEQGARLVGRETYYQLLSGRGGYVRKMALRLRPIPFEGRDHRAQAVVAAMDEVFRFAPFRVPVRLLMIERLGFLQIPPSQLQHRKVFEPAILMTVADLLWSGRISVPESVRYRNRWLDVPPLPPSTPLPSPATWVAGLRRRLEAAGDMFQGHCPGHSVIRDGRISLPRLRTSSGDQENEDEEPGPSIRLPPIGIVDLLWEVHAATGFLDAFRLTCPAPRRLPEDKRRRLAIACLIALGLNLGLKDASQSLGRWYKLGRLRNFSENYFTEKNLRDALANIISTWERLGLGKTWGPGTSCSVDGRVVFSYANNTISAYHHRKGRVGVTIYWMVRDDHLGASVRIIGNQEWESWYILDDLLRPAGGQMLEMSAGDTHGQHLAAWGLAGLVGKRITTRFRQLGQVRLYGPRKGHWLGLHPVGTVDWGLLRKTMKSLHRLAAAVRSGAIEPSEVLRTWNIYDERGRNVSEALRELGKVDRTDFILRYASLPEFRKEIHNTCQRAENWNSFQQAIFFGRGGRIETNDPGRRRQIGIAMALILNSIVFYNAWRWGARLRKVKGATPVMWRHIRLLGRYRFTREPSPSGK